MLLCNHCETAVLACCINSAAPAPPTGEILVQQIKALITRFKMSVCVVLLCPRITFTDPFYAP